MKNVRTAAVLIVTLFSLIQASAANGSKRLVTDSITQQQGTATIITDFSAVRTRNSVVLSWVTQSTVNGGKFVIEKSNDGTNWAVLGTTLAASERTQASVYYYGDNKPSGTTYYRVLTTDGNDSGRYTQIIRTTASNK